MAILKWLKGKKSYLICVTGILGAIVAYLSGEMSLIQLVEAVMIALGGMSLRAGISKIGQ